MYRTEDSMDQGKCYEYERRLGSLEKDVEMMNTAIITLKEDVKEEQAEIKEVIKDLAKSQKDLALSMAKIESGISALVKSLPVIFVFMSGIWAYSTFVLDRTETPHKIGN